MPAAKAPQTVNNFVVLAVNGYYTGLTFHRVDTYFVQGGDPQGDGRGGPGYTLPDETNDLPWTTNAVGMARDAGGPVNGSQFFLLKTGLAGNGPRRHCLQQLRDSARWNPDRHRDQGGRPHPFDSDHGSVNFLAGSGRRRAFVAR